MERTTLEHHFRPKLEVSNSDPSSPFGSFRDPEQHNRLSHSKETCEKCLTKGKNSCFLKLHKVFGNKECIDLSVL